MRSFIIHLLGGYTAEEYDNLGRTAYAAGKSDLAARCRESMEHASSDGYLPSQEEQRSFIVSRAINGTGVE